MVEARKPNGRKKGLKVLVYGDTGTGKTLFGLSFPKLAAVDSEDGYGWYEDDAEGKNIIAIYDTQNFYDLEEILDELEDRKDIQTLVIDSETKIYENLQQALLETDEKRARKNGKDELDTNVSVRSWGKIKQISTKLQNAKIRLASRGIHLVSVAQQADVTEEVSANKRIKVGVKPDMKKKANYDYDVVIRLYQDTDTNKYMGIIEKDRTKVTKKGQVIENPSFEIWEKRINSKSNQGESVKKDFVSDSNKSRAAYEKKIAIEEEKAKPADEQIKDFVMNIEDKSLKKEFASLLQTKLGVKALSKMTQNQLEAGLKLIETFKAEKGLS